MSDARKILLSVRNAGVVYRTGTPIFRRRHRFEALKNISFELYHGESLGIIGRNGAGKTTLLRLLNGVIEPDSGTVVNPGHSVSLLTLAVGFDPNISGRHNAVLSGLLLGMDRPDIERRIRSIFHFAELEDYIDVPVKNYSNGMRVRLGFSIAIQVQTDVLLIDEVLSVGDYKFRKKSEKHMRQKLKSGDTIVFVSHNASHIKDLCDRAIWVERGESVMAGKARDVVEAYENRVQSEVQKDEEAGGEMVS